MPIVIATENSKRIAALFVEAYELIRAECETDKEAVELMRDTVEAMAAIRLTDLG